MASPERQRVAREPDELTNPIGRRAWPLRGDLSADGVRPAPSSEGELQAYQTQLTCAWAPKDTVTAPDPGRQLGSRKAIKPYAKPTQRATNRAFNPSDDRALNLTDDMP
jgi:hypothetical protein